MEELGHLGVVGHLALYTYPPRLPLKAIKGLCPECPILSLNMPKFEPLFPMELHFHTHQAVKRLGIGGFQLSVFFC